MANILILRNAHPNASDIKTVYSEDQVVENGYVVALGEVSTEREHRNAFKAETPAVDKIHVMIYNADVPVITDENGNTYKGIVSDPRNIKFVAGTNVNAYMPSVGEEIAMTEIAGEKSSNEYVVYKASDMKPTYAADKSDALIAYKITGEKFVSIGNERVATVELICVKA